MVMYDDGDKMIDFEDISGWQTYSGQADDMFGRGTLQKKIVKDSAGNKYLFKQTWTRKRGEYTDAVKHQFWCEYISAKIAEMMQLTAADTKIALDKKQAGIIIKWFDKLFLTGKEILSVGLDLLSGDIDYSERHQSLEYVLSHTHKLNQKATIWWMQLILFDALIGNGDRHHENWGMFVKKGLSFEFSPIFDSGVCLGWRLQEHEFENFNFEQYFSKYKTKIPVSLNNGSHKIADMIVFFVENGVPKKTMLEFISHFDINKLKRDVFEKQVNHINEKLPDAYCLTEARQDFMLKFLNFRHQALIKMLKD